MGLVQCRYGCRAIFPPPLDPGRQTTSLTDMAAWLMMMRRHSLWQYRAAGPHKVGPSFVLFFYFSARLPESDSAA